MCPNQLIAGCKKRDERSQKALYDLLHPQMLGVCLRYARDREEAQDILQEGFIRVFQKIDSFTATGSFIGWVKKVMVNTALEHYRRNRSKAEEVPLKHESLMVVAGEDVLEDLKARDILSLVQQLPTGYRMVFNLFAIEGYSHEEISKQLNISVNTSYSQYHRARALLQKMLAPEKKIATKKAV